jgi:hypothetical protein
MGRGITERGCFFFALTSNTEPASDPPRAVASNVKAIDMTTRQERAKASKPWKLTMPMIEHEIEVMRAEERAKPKGVKITPEIRAALKALRTADRAVFACPRSGKGSRAAVETLVVKRLGFMHNLLCLLNPGRGQR